MDTNKLPKWAQEQIKKLQRQRDTAVKLLEEYLNEQTPSAFSYDDFSHLGEDQGKFTTKYVQTHKMEVEHAGVHLTIILREKHIDLQWGGVPEHHGEMAFIPASHQAAYLVSKENMR